MCELESNRIKICELQLKMISIAKEKEEDSYEVELLLDLVFGLGRETLSSYRFRDGVKRIPELCNVLRDEFGVLVGVIRYWPILIGDNRVRGLLLGPLGIHPTRQGEGLGKLLIDMSLKKAKMLGWRRVILIGELSYYNQFGFSKRVVSNIYMNDKLASDRLLGYELVDESMKSVKGPLLKYPASK